VLGLGLDSTSFPRPLWIFDNKYSLEMDGITDGIQIARSADMLADGSVASGNAFTAILWVGDAEVEWGQSSAGDWLMGNSDGSGWNFLYESKKLRVNIKIQDPSDATQYENVILVGPHNRMAHGYGDTTDSYSTGDGGWNMLVITFDGSASGGAETKLYVGGGTGTDPGDLGNGVHLADTENATNGGTALSYGAKHYSDEVDMGVGCGFQNSSNTPAYHSATTVDNFAYFNQCLTIEELTTIYNSGEGINMLEAHASIGTGDPYTTAMVSKLKCHLRLEGGSGGAGTTLTDVSGNGNSGEIVGSPDWTSNVPATI